MKAHSTIRTGTAGAAAILLIFAAGTVVAQDTKVMAGSACSRVTGTNPQYLQGHTIYNGSTTSKFGVTCPMIRDDETDPKWNNYLLVYVRDNRSDDNEYCTGGIGIYNSTAFYEVADWTTNAQVGNYQLAMSAPAGSYGASSAWSMRCELPRANGSDYSRVYSYNYSE